MDEVVARQLPSRTLGHTPAESEDEEGTSLRDLRDESRLGAQDGQEKIKTWNWRKETPGATGGGGRAGVQSRSPAADAAKRPSSLQARRW